MVARLKDVAALAGVSVKTASNVVNNYPYVSPATRAKVQAAVKQLRYRPNLSARQLKHGRAGLLALAVPELEAPYFAELGARISTEAARLGSIVLLDATGADPAAEQVVLSGMRTHLIDGVIFSPLAVGPDDIAARADTIPMVLLGERAVPPGFDHVAVDSVTASQAMTDHLISLGRTRIAAIGHEPIAGTASVRLAGYRQALEAAGHPYRPELVIGVGRYDRADGKAAMERLLALPEPPDAVFCFNDLMAIGAIRACVETGLDVPGEIAVAGFDDIAEGRFGNPTLTTVAADLELLARESLRLLLARIAEPDRPAESVTVPWTLRLRESSIGR